MRTISRTFIAVAFALLPSLGHAAQPRTAGELIPFSALTESNRVIVAGVTDHYTLRREYAPRKIKARQVDFEYLLDHMDACSTLAQQIGLIKYRAIRDADGWLHANDHNGAEGVMISVCTNASTRVFFLNGSQKGALSVHGRGVAIVEYKPTAPDTLEYTGAQFIKVDNAVVAVLTQVFQVFVRGTVDSHFVKLMRQPTVLCEMAVTAPQELLYQIGKMPEADRQLLAPFAAQLRSAQSSHDSK